MAIFKLLPQTNCKQCGEPTCFTFALKLAAAQKQLAACPPMVEPQYAAKLAAPEAYADRCPGNRLKMSAVA